eukprot:gene1991-1450_t
MGNVLTGTFPRAVSTMTSLETLNLGSNTLMGTLPTSASWTGLQEFNVSNNQFNGSLPALLSRLSTLQLLVVNNNQLSGTIPADGLSPWAATKKFIVAHNHLHGNIERVLDQATTLIHLDVSNNRFNGTLPPAWSSLPLEYLNVSTNRFIGEPATLLSIWTTLKVIDLSANSFVGSIPTALADNTMLQTINFQDNQLTGTIPWVIGRLKALEIVEMSQNKLKGRLPVSFFNSTTLVSLDLSSNTLNGSIPATIRLPRLQKLRLNNNKLVGSFSDALCNAPNLVSLYLQSNALAGTLPTCLCRWKALRSLQASENDFTGGIPSCIGNASSLTRLIIYGNRLEGSIPSSVGDLSLLTVFNAAENGLTGTLPSTIGQLHKLESLILYSNFLVGTLPGTLGNLSSVQFMDFCNNSLNGTIPTSFGALAKTLVQLNISANDLTGSIPAELGQLLLLQRLELYDNYLEGTLPATLSKWKRLVALDIERNLLQGTIPTSLFQLVKLSYLYLSENLMTGTIPVGFNQLPVLQYLSLANNQFNGTIPDSLLHGTIDNIDVSNNVLTGSLDGLLMGTGPSVIAANGNLLHGAPLANVNRTAASTSMTATATATTTATATATTTGPLIFLNLSTNFLSGTISDTLATCTDMKTLDISCNHFTGSLPTATFQSMTDIGTLRINVNALEGTLSPSFVNSSRPYLILDINHNAFHGTLPAGVFARGNLQSFAASLNCFTGTLPRSLCANLQIEEVLLDGLHSSSHCIDKVVPWFADSGYVTDGSVHGTIPACLLALPQINTIHLAGNSLTGSLGDVLSASLQYLDASYNVLTGTIPDAIWTHNFTVLSLSNNKLTGTIPSYVTTQYSDRNDTTIHIDVNRLSGRIPQALMAATDINMLTGNMFACGRSTFSSGPASSSSSSSSSPSSSELPMHDPAAHSYECGSNYTNGSLLATVITQVLLLGLAWAVMAVYYDRHALWQKYQQYMAYYATEERLRPMLGGGDAAMPNYYFHYKVNSDRFLAFASLLTLVVVVVGMPIYAALSIPFSTYEYAYIWTVSLAFLWSSSSSPDAPPSPPSPPTALGPAAAAVMASPDYEATLLALANHRAAAAAAGAEGGGGGGGGGVSSTATTWRLSLSQAHRSSWSTLSQSLRTSISSSRTASTTDSTIAPSVLSASMTTSTTATPPPSIAAAGTPISTYIDTSERGLSTIDQLSLSLAICVYKLVWGNVVINEIVSKLGFVWFDIQVRSSFKVLLLLFNTIIAPYVVNGAINSDCFGNAIIRPAQIVSATTGATCYLLGYNTYVDTNYNASYITTSTLFSCEERSAIPSNVTIIGDYASSTPIAFYPPFQYNYQCSSSLISNFTFLLVIRFAMSGCCVPWVFFTLKQLQVWCMHRYGPASWVFWACTKCLPVLHRPMDLTEMLPTVQERRRYQLQRSAVDRHLTGPSQQSQQAQEQQRQDELLRDRCRVVNGLILRDLLKQPILTPQTIRIRMIVELAMVLAFGVVFPPLAIVGLWSIFVDVRMSELILARLFALYEDIGSSEACPLQELIDVTNMKFAKFDEKLLRGISLSQSTGLALVRGDGP